MSINIILLGGAYKNSGDYLIEKRAHGLIREVFPLAHIDRIARNEISSNIEMINKHDVAVFIGGPLLMLDLDGYLPLDNCINDIRIPMMLLGVGWYGRYGGDSFVNHYVFSPKTYKFLEKVDNEGFGIGCRDLHSFRCLKNQGFKNAFLTGCPAWYNLDKIDSLNVSSHHEGFKKIVVSDPAKPYNRSSMKDVVLYLKQRYPQAEIHVVYHRGKTTSSFNNIDCVAVHDIAGSSDGFSIYDDCDLHVGFRVHAHIYNLSLRNKSVLIEEDGRGAGVNEILGLPSIKAYNDGLQFQNRIANLLYRKLDYSKNRGLVNDLDCYLTSLEETEYLYMENAYRLQKNYFREMISFINRINLVDKTHGQ